MKSAALAMAAPLSPSLTITNRPSYKIHPLRHIKPIILRTPLSPPPPPPSHGRKNIFLRIYAAAPPSISTIGKSETSWNPVFLTGYLDTNYPTRFTIRNRPLLISFDETSKEWVAFEDKRVALIPEGRIPQASVQSPIKFPTMVSGGVLFVWADENGWERARATMLPDLKLKFILRCGSTGCTMMISEMLPNDYKASDLISDNIPTELTAIVCLLQRGAFEYPSADLKSSKGDSTTGKSIETAAQALELPTKGDYVNEDPATGVPKPLHIRIGNSVSWFVVKNKDIFEALLKLALPLTFAGQCKILGSLFKEKSRGFQFGALSIVLALVFYGLEILKEDNKTATK